ncbi:MAG: LysR family transcriptional regulator [Oscillospiraceae bacterium]|nr:LysR family transcriptional regulator [Oscillospiraceae bacterium]
MEIRQLKYFLAVADQRSFVSAAAVLYISRQAVSKAIAQLEEELDVELFMRDSNGAFLTPAGVLFYDRVRSSVMDLEQLRREMQEYGTRYRQRVRILFSVGILPLFESALEAYRDMQKNVEIVYGECPAAQCEERLLARTADLAVTSLPAHDSLLLQKTLLSSPYGVLSTADNEARQAPVLSSVPVACMEETPELDSFFESGGVQPIYRGYDCNRLFSLVRDGRCVMLLPRCLKPDDLRFFSLDSPPVWTVNRLCLESVEQNLMYRTLLDELQMWVLRDPCAKKGGDAS